mgnify:CR=1 FL=1
MIDVNSLWWVAGFLEGEGCFMPPPKSACISAVQVQKEPLERLSSVLGGTVLIVKRTHKNPKHQDAWRWHLIGVHAVAAGMTLYSLMSPKRKTAIRAMIAAWREQKIYQRLRTSCPYGHPYSAKNTYVPPKTNLSPGNRRICRTCVNRRSRAYSIAHKPH